MRIRRRWGGGEGAGDTPFNGPYREAPSERGTVIRLQASGTCLQIGEILQECYPKSLYYYCMFSHSSQGNSMVRIISWKRPSLVTMLLLKQRELIRQETLCSGNSIVFIPNCLVASFSEAHPYPKPSLPLLRAFLKLCFCKVLQTHYFVVKHESL